VREATSAVRKNGVKRCKTCKRGDARRNELEVQRHVQVRVQSEVASMHVQSV